MAEGNSTATGLVHIYTGEGKGKTTAAVGLAVRAAGRGLRVGFFQFLKNGTSGELSALQRLGVEVDSPKTGKGCKFVWDMNDAERAEYAAVQSQTLARAAAAAPGLDLLVLDEALGAAGTGLLARAALTAFIAQKPPALELVLTGRSGEEDGELLALADYVTEMRMIRHPYEKGVAARRGVEF